MSTAEDNLALELACPYCNAKSEEWCKTKSSKRSTYLHTDRTWLIQRAWSLGYHEGSASALDNAAGWFQKRREGNRWAQDAPLVGLDVISWLLKQKEYWTT